MNAPHAQRGRLTLRLHLILNHQSLALVVNLLGELGGNGVVSCDILHHETLVAFHSLENGRFFNGPFTDKSPLILGLGVLLLSLGRDPSRFPALGELFQERRFQGCRLLLTKVSWCWDLAVTLNQEQLAVAQTYRERRLLRNRRGISLVLSLLSMSIAHESGRGDQSRSKSCIETHDGRSAQQLRDVGARRKTNKGSIDPE